LEGFVLFIHIVVCVLLVIIVLLQSGKSADLAGAFGGVGSQSTFGPRGAATFLSKMTTTLAILFMVTSLTLWIIASNKAGGPEFQPEDVKQQQTETTPTTTSEETTDKDKADQKKGATQPPAESSDKKDKTKETQKKEKPGKKDSEKQPGNS
jgi:preprotein translocase subunit SecG